MRIVRIAINAVALLLAALLVEDIEIDWGDAREGLVITLVALAMVFGVVNAFIRPIARLVSIPLNVATLGMFSVVLNALLLLLVAFLIDLVLEPLIVIGGFPPDLSLQSVVAAATGAVIISLVATALTVLIPDP